MSSARLPPPAFLGNAGMARTNASQPKEHMVTLGSGGYNRAITGMMSKIANLTRNIEVWNCQLGRLSADSAKHQEITCEVDKATREINHLNELHTEVTKFCSTLGLRTVGWTLHSSPIKVSAESLGYAKDWGFIELDPKQIDMVTFSGNKIFIGGKYTPGDFVEAMYPHHEDRAGYWYPEDTLLQAFGVVSAADISNPKHLDANGQQCLLVVKNSGSTDTTFGRANGLESVKRSYPEYGIEQQDSLELAVLSYSKGYSKFSDTSDSSSIVVTRKGEILGLLTGGAGPAGETDVTWLTPFWWLQDQIKERYPDTFLYPVVES